jgi:pilus assembly protein Flp/PilA
MGSTVQKFLGDESGATAIEYALIASLVFLMIIAAVKAVGTKLSATFANVSGNL